MPYHKNARPTRLTLELPAQTHDQLLNLMHRTGSTTKSEVLRKALALLDFATKARARGHRVGALDENGTIVLEFVGF